MLCVPGVLLFDNISFTVERFEHLMIAGPSGMGVTSTLVVLTSITINGGGCRWWLVIARLWEELPAAHASGPVACD